MKTTSTLKAITLIAALSAIGSVSAGETRGLEPCLNGEVSASGLYPSQAIEDAVRASGRSLDASLNGEVSASGLYPTQAMEDAALAVTPATTAVRVAAPHERSLEPAINGEVSARGNFATQAEEDAHDSLRLSNPVAAR